MDNSLSNVNQISHLATKSVDEKKINLLQKRNDNDLGIDWNVSNPIISFKDKEGLHFKDFKSKFDD